MNRRPGTRRRAATAVAALALTAGAVAGCASTASSAAPAQPGTADAPSSLGTAEVALDIRVAGGTVTPAPADVPVARGGTVRLRVTSDVADEVHVHGYDLEQSVPAGGTVTFDFVADQPGTFPVETHETELTLTRLVVS